MKIILDKYSFRINLYFRDLDYEINRIINFKMVEEKMKSRHSSTKRSFDLNCKYCGMSITVKCAKEMPGSDVIFVCCGEEMKLKH